MCSSKQRGGRLHLWQMDLRSAWPGIQMTVSIQIFPQPHEKEKKIEYNSLTKLTLKGCYVLQTYYVEVLYDQSSGLYWFSGLPKKWHADSCSMTRTSRAVTHVITRWREEWKAHCRTYSKCGYTVMFCSFCVNSSLEPKNLDVTSHYSFSTTTSNMLIDQWISEQHIFNSCYHQRIS